MPYYRGQADDPSIRSTEEPRASRLMEVRDHLRNSPSCPFSVAFFAAIIGHPAKQFPSGAPPPRDGELRGPGRKFNVPRVITARQILRSNSCIKLEVRNSVSCAGCLGSVALAGEREIILVPSSVPTTDPLGRKTILGEFPLVACVRDFRDSYD